MSQSPDEMIGTQDTTSSTSGTRAPHKSKRKDGRPLGETGAPGTVMPGIIDAWASNDAKEMLYPMSRTVVPETSKSQERVSLGRKNQYRGHYRGQTADRPKSWRLSAPQITREKRQYQRDARRATKASGSGHDR